MTETRPTISTHVLDTATGQPAPGVAVLLDQVGPDGARRLTEATTDADGRIRDLLGLPLEQGRYRLTVDVGRGRDGAFFTSVSLELDIRDTTRSYHVPLLLAPFGMTTYRGS